MIQSLAYIDQRLKEKKDSATVVGYEGILRLWYERDNTETKTRIFIIVTVSLVVLFGYFSPYAEDKLNTFSSVKKQMRGKGRNSFPRRADR